MATLYLVGTLALCTGLVFREICQLKAKISVFRHLGALKRHQERLGETLAHQSIQIEVLQSLLAEAHILSGATLQARYHKLLQSPDRRVDRYDEQGQGAAAGQGRQTTRLDLH